MKIIAIEVAVWTYAFFAAWIVFFLALLFSPKPPGSSDPVLFYMDRWMEKAMWLPWRLIPDRYLKLL